MIKLSAVQEKANPTPRKVGNISNFERGLVIPPNAQPTSIKLSSHHREYLDGLVKEQKFYSRSEAIRYCIQFAIDLETVSKAYAIALLEMK